MTEKRPGASDEGSRQLVAVSASYEQQTQPIVRREVIPLQNYHPYPSPLAKYEEVTANRKLFMDTLEKLHAELGTKFMVPTIGGKELDLHRLFVEVTSRGGLEKIIRERRWKDVTAVFSFPSTATNASFVLRKYYVSLIHHYEQIYFFGAKGWTSPTPAALPVSSSAHIPSQGPVEPMQPASEVQAASQKRRRSMGSPSSMCCPVVGVIDGKFEHGYLVTVTVGNEKLKGVLYHTPEYSLPLVPQYSGVPNNSGSLVAPLGVRRRRRRRKSEMRKRDPFHPKANRSGYNFFFQEQHARLKPLHPGKDKEISKMIGELWNKLTETEKAVYQEKGAKDKERYLSEMEEYRQKKNRLIVQNAVPLQQRLAVPEVAMVDADSKLETESGLPEAVENESSSEGSDSEEEKLADKDEEVEVSPETETGSESANPEPANPVAGSSVDGDGFELRRRDHGEKESEVGGSSLGDVSETTKKESSEDGH